MAKVRNPREPGYGRGRFDPRRSIESHGDLACARVTTEGCRVGRGVILSHEAEKRAHRGTLPLSETPASAHRESGRSELVPRERLVGMPGHGQSPCGPGLSGCCSQI